MLSYHGKTPFPFPNMLGLYLQDEDQENRPTFVNADSQSKIVYSHGWLVSIMITMYNTLVDLMMA